MCHCDQYEYLKMPFGLTNALAVFQRAMNIILQPFMAKFAMVYLDDMIVFSKSQEGHLEHLQQVFEKCKEAGLTLKESKCHFCKESIDGFCHFQRWHWCSAR